MGWLRLAVWFVGVCGMGLIAAGSVLAQPAFPNKPIRMVVPFPPGGTLDVLARIISEKLSANMGQPVVVENRPAHRARLEQRWLVRRRRTGTY